MVSGEVGGALKHGEQVLVEMVLGEELVLIGPRLLDDGVATSIVLTPPQAVALVVALGGEPGIEIEPEPQTA